MDVQLKNAWAKIGTVGSMLTMSAVVVQDSILYLESCQVKSSMVSSQFAVQLHHAPRTSSATSAQAGRLSFIQPTKHLGELSRVSCACDDQSIFCRTAKEG